MSFQLNIPVAVVGSSTTCIACGIRLPSIESQHQHHKSDWHTYNLKRKLVGLPPVSADVFTQLVTASREQANPAEEPQPECVPCGKKYLSDKSYENHLASKKHRLTAQAWEKKQQQQQQQRKTDDEEETSMSEASPGTDDESTTPTTSTKTTLEPSATVCLFCSHASADATDNYAHMRSTHSFFLPRAERLIDLDGMLTYLADKLSNDLDCLWCTPSVFDRTLSPDQELNSSFSSLANVRRHMLDKGHCKVYMDNGADREYADFYLSDKELATRREGDPDSEEDGFVKLYHDRQTQGDGNQDLTEQELEDEARLSSVLLDQDGNWILDDQDDNTRDMKVDPETNELILNGRRLAHKDAVRAQRVESRVVTLTSIKQAKDQQRAEQEQAQRQQSSGEEEGSTTTSTELLHSGDVHQPSLKHSKALPPSQNQLSQSNQVVSLDQHKDLARKVTHAQQYETSKYYRQQTHVSVQTNIHGRRRINLEFGTKN
ncbi:hypothetical protein DFQ26_000471 [Actinomortierella ambigua]|nr:hypothetical protein DFQ26_000471 [Actinomortierella ambigua]